MPPQLLLYLVQLMLECGSTHVMQAYSAVSLCWCTFNCMFLWWASAVSYHGLDPAKAALDNTALLARSCCMNIAEEVLWAMVVRLQR